MSIHECDQGSHSKYLLVMKGAPERILEVCSTILVNDRELKLNKKWKKNVNAAYLNLGGRGEVLGNKYWNFFLNPFN